MSYWPQKYGDPETLENIDYEKHPPPAYAKYFEETSSPQQVTKQLYPEEEPAYAKYFKEEPKKRGLLENAARKVLDIPSESAFKGLVSLPHSLGELSAFVNKFTGTPLGGLAANFKDLFPSYESLTEKFKQFGLHTEPEGFVEKAIEKAARFGGESPVFGGIGGARGAIGLAGAGVGAQGAEELGTNLPGSIALTVAGDLAAHRLTGGAVTAYKALMNPKKAFAESYMFRHKPTEKMKEAIEAFERQNIQPPLTSVTKAPLGKFLEKEASLNPMTEQVFDDFRKNLSDNAISLWDKALDEGSKIRVPTREEAASRLKNAATAERDLKRQAVSDAYSKAAQTLPPDARISVEGSGRLKEKAEGLNQSVNTLLKSAEDIGLKEKTGELLKNIESFQYEKSLPYDELMEVLNTYQGKSINLEELNAGFEKAKDLYPEISDQFDEIRNLLKERKTLKGKKPTKEDLIGEIEAIRDREASLPIEVLEGTNKSINSILDYEVQGGLKNRLREVQKSIEHELDEFAKTNPKYKEYRDFAKKEHGQLAQLFRNDLGRSILFGERPEQILRGMSTPSGIKQVENIAGKNSEVMNVLKRHKLEDWLTDKLISEGEFRLGGTKTANLHRNKEMFDALTTPKQREYFKDLTTIDQSIRKGMAKYLNTSGTENLRQALSNWTSMTLEPLIALVQGRPLSAAIAPLSPLIKGKIAHLATDPEFITLVKNAQKSVEKGKSPFISATQALVDYLDNKSQEK